MADIAAPLDSLPTTRRAILLALRKQGQLSVDDLAAALGITGSAVRQHLAGLEADGFVAHSEHRSGPGRPRFRYHLAPGAEPLFPKTYGALTNELLEYVEDEDAELLERVFERRRARRVECARARLAGRSPAEQVAELTRILDEDGYLADVEPIGEGAFRVVEHNCAILEVALRYGQACGAEIGFIREVLPDFEVERVAHLMAGSHVCAYEMRPRRPHR